jgi:hypothetical protein
MGYRRMFAVLFMLQLTGCADFARWVRQYTYPSEFHYLERDEIRSAMNRLAFHSRELNQLLRSSDDNQAKRSEIIAHLKAMDEAAEKLDKSGGPGNHPLIDTNLPRLRRDLKFAQEAIEREPPNFSLAGSVTGACVYCHAAR